MDTTDPVVALVALAPIVALVGLVVRGRWTTLTNALLAVAAATVLAGTVFGAGPAVVGVAVAKGLWSGLWIVYVVVPALVLYRVAQLGGLERIGDRLSVAVREPVERILLLAWILPSLIQGVAGFGTPIAVAAPLLVALGVPPVRAVALPLIGYHWSVTFGSMGSSYLMGVVTGGLSPSEAQQFATTSATVLSVNLLLGGLGVALLYGGLPAVRRGWRALLVGGGAMVVALQLCVRVQPTVGSLVAGAAGMAALLAVQAVGRGTTRDRTTVPAPAGEPAGAPVGEEASTSDAGATADGLLRPLTPYLVLLAAIAAVHVPPAVRAFAHDHLVVAPSLPTTATAAGHVNPAVEAYTAIELLAHPGSFLLLAAVVGLGLHRRALGPGAVRGWAAGLGARAIRSAAPILALTTLAAVMVDAGMVRAVAEGAAAAVGSAYPLLAAPLGALGSFATGSTTTSNALFGALQADTARLLGQSPTVILSAQTAGGNVGNAIAPVVVLIGVTAVGGATDERAVLRQVAPPVAAFLAVVVGVTLLL
ncbi:L-lactate permease [Nitriliruptoraceae bacterium ZYF776]|nr:L-lactate permease [Profundirhabdus halotolerans]